MEPEELFWLPKTQVAGLNPTALVKHNNTLPDLKPSGLFGQIFL